MTLSGIVGAPTNKSSMFSLISEVRDIRDLFSGIERKFNEIEKNVRALDSKSKTTGFENLSDRVSRLELTSKDSEENISKQEFEDNNQRVLELFEVLVKKQLAVKERLEVFEKKLRDAKARSPSTKEVSNLDNHFFAARSETTIPKERSLE